VRVPRDLADAMRASAGQTPLRLWMRAVLRSATTYGSRLGNAFASGIEHSEGWRAGWAAANRQFREALKIVLGNEPPEAP